MHFLSTAEVAPRTEGGAQAEGRYIYCVADSGDGVKLGKIGIDRSEVYTVPYRDICAVTHTCPATPYQSRDEEVVKAWVTAHHRVVDIAWERWATVLPMTFDIILKGSDGGSAQQNVEGWLRQEYDRLKSKLDKVEGKAEYGVQVLWNVDVIARNLAETSPEIKRLQKELGSKSPGLAYMYRQKLENLLKREMEAKASQFFKDCYVLLGRHVADIRVEKTKPSESGQQMIVNLSCLMERDRYRELGSELQRFKNTNGVSVRFTGPWPPYSFVGGP